MPSFISTNGSPTSIVSRWVSAFATVALMRPWRSTALCSRNYPIRLKRYGIAVLDGC